MKSSLCGVILGGVLCGFGSAEALAAPEAPAQLNVGGFAYCLAQEAPYVDLESERIAHELNREDLLLLYLSVYPGKRLPLPLSLLQDRARARWETGFEEQASALAGKLAARGGMGSGALAPARLFGDALDSCGGSVFCAALVSHDVLRTLGRHDQAVYDDPLTGARHNLNPHWFIADESGWLERIPALRALLLPLRPDRRGDGWGEWYHFFGILAYSVHELALNQSLGGVELVVRLNELLNPLLAGGPETPEKARLDRDAVQVAYDFVRGEGLVRAGSCEERASYVASALASNSAIVYDSSKNLRARAGSSRTIGLQSAAAAKSRR